MGKIYIGTSGFSYPWPKFYPPHCKQKEKLSFYALYFPATEINYSFYRLPSKKSIDEWLDSTPEGFRFAMKLSRYITHVKRCKGVKAACLKFQKRAQLLEGKLAPILVQLPDNFSLDLQRLELFLSYWDRRRFSLALEFRHPSWFCKEVYALLKKNKVALVFSQAKDFPYPKEEPLTSSFVYIRLHGPNKLYDSPYGETMLSQLAKRLHAWKKERDVYIFFNNDGHGYAHQDALLLQEIVGE